MYDNDQIILCAVSPVRSAPRPRSSPLDSPVLRCLLGCLLVLASPLRLLPLSSSGLYFPPQAFQNSVRRSTGPQRTKGLPQKFRFGPSCLPPPVVSSMNLLPKFLDHRLEAFLERPAMMLLFRDIGSRGVVRATDCKMVPKPGDICVQIETNRSCKNPTKNFSTYVLSSHSSERPHSHSTPFWHNHPPMSTSPVLQHHRYTATDQRPNGKFFKNV